MAGVRTGAEGVRTEISFLQCFGIGVRTGVPTAVAIGVRTLLSLLWLKRPNLFLYPSLRALKIVYTWFHSLRNPNIKKRQWATLIREDGNDSL